MKNFSFSILVLCALLCVGCARDSYLGYEDQSQTSTESIAKEGEHSGIYVQISGAVAKPGVYELLPGEDRVFHLIEKSGGFLEDAYLEDINQVAKISDGMRIHVSTKEEALNKQQLDMESGKVNINTADANLLMTLDGVGQSKADMIIEYRTSNGPFVSIEDIMNISGIKEGLFSKIKDKITV